MPTGGEAPLPIRAAARLPKCAPVGRWLVPCYIFSRKERKDRKEIFKTSRTSSASLREVFRELTQPGGALIVSVPFPSALPTGGRKEKVI
jgi:hypothetical protein